MYKLLLCWRYLRTRYIALASIISVTLGVATMIVVNSVMSGFSTEMKSRLHGILSDITFEARSLDGMPDAEWHMEQIRRVAGDQIEGMTATVVVPAMLSFQYGGNWITRQVQLIGIDEQTHADVGDFARYLQHPRNRERLSFDLRERGYDVVDHQAGPTAAPRRQMEQAGWDHRRRVAAAARLRRELLDASDGVGAPRPGTAAAPEFPAAAGPDSAASPAPVLAGAARLAHAHDTIAPGATDVAGSAGGTFGPVSASAAPHEIDSPAGPTGAAASDALGNTLSGAGPDGPGSAGSPPGAVAAAAALPGTSSKLPAVDPFAGRVNPVTASDPFAAAAGAGQEFDPARQQHTGVIGGIAMFSFRSVDGEDRFLALPGDDVKLTFPTAGTPPRAVSSTFTLVDFYESKMSEYDSSLVFAPIRQVQELRGMYDLLGGRKRYYVNVIQIKLRPGADLDAVRDRLRAAFAEELYGVYTWRDKQGPLLAAVQMETAILNVLLFLIIAVAGFGILAIFYMIVVEKTRDIGILKSLGAPSRGVMGIFLGYGLSLGIVGSGVGLVLGLVFVAHINEIADLLGWLSGRPLFDPSVYYFYRIPAIVEPATVAWIVVGALAIAVAASILPARRAARLHPVEALRYE